MPLNWMDVSDVPFDALLLLERVQINWFRGWDFPRPEISIALAANPHVCWYMCHKAPEMAGWVNDRLAEAHALLEKIEPPDAAKIRLAEQKVLASMEDLLVYALDPSIYDRQPFLAWDSNELTSLVDFNGKTVIDMGSGTGRLAFTAAPLAKTVYAVEPVGNLRDFIREKARALGLTNVYAVDGLITAIPFADDFADVTMGGHVFGDFLKEEAAELERVTKPGGMIILCPGNNDCDNDIHRFLVWQGYQWSAFEEPQDGGKRKYWKVREGE